MAKAINWPNSFRETILAEGTETVYTAVRLGRLYYDHCFWVDQEVVDIRVNHLRIRKGVVQGDLALYAIADIPTDVYSRLRPGMQDQESLVNYLKSTYADDTVTLETLVTVVNYKNLPVIADEIETPANAGDPHHVAS